MEKRVVVFIILSIAIFIFWQHFFITPKLEEQKKAQEKINAQQKLNKKDNEKLSIKPKESNSVEPSIESIEKLREKGLLSQTKNIPERTIEVNTPLYCAKFSNMGGVLTSFRLKEHWDIPPDPEKIDNKLLLEKDLEKIVSENLKPIYSSSQLVNDYISLRKLIDQIESKITDEIPDDSSFREALMSFVSNTAGKTPKKIREELIAIQSYLSSKLILEDIAERREKVKKILNEIKVTTEPSSDLLDQLKIESGVDMVSAISRKVKDYPLGVHDSKGELDFSNIAFETNSTNLMKIYSNKDSEKLKFVSSIGQNNEILLVKEYKFLPDSYIFDMQFTVVNNSDKNLDLGELVCDWGPGITYMNGSITKKYTHEGLLASIYGSIKKDLKGTMQASWAAIEDSFFVISFFKENNISMFNMNPGLSIPNMSILSSKEQINAGGSQTFQIRCYCGPKQISYLRKAGMKLENIVDYGWFSFIAVPLLEGMKFLYRYIPNYGWVIIIITIVIRIIFFPLNAKSMKSMKKMQALQPKIKELKDKYKNDKQKMNIEMMALYKKNDVNPMGGCLPMLIQIPILFALFRLLPITIEFRHQPFIFWIRDLTAKDPYYVTPILMGISMIYQQKLSPTSVDPKQAQIMMFMPIIFTFLFLNFSSGLVLYWLTSNILAIGQQYLMNRNTETEKKGHKK
jgi:YidC/Oxa1 family membrane protein insertase